MTGEATSSKRELLSAKTWTYQKTAASSEEEEAIEQENNTKPNTSIAVK